MTIAATSDHERFHSMEDHDLLVEIAVKTDALEAHSAEQNDQILKLNETQLRMEGALTFGRWVLGTTLAVMATGATIAGIILAYVARSG